MMNFLSYKTEIDSTRMHYVRCGNGKPVILIHGLTNNWEGHIPLATILSRKYSVFIPDLPGYGESGSLPGYDFDIMASYLQKFTEKIGLNSFTLIGLSMGGVIAAHYARANPLQVEAVVVMGPVLNDKPRAVRYSKYFFRSVRAIPAGCDALKKFVNVKRVSYFTAEHINMYRFDRQLIDLYGTHGRELMSATAYVDMGIAVAGYDLDKTLTELQVPTLLVYGSHDKFSKNAYAIDSLLPQNRNLSVSVVDFAGHIVSLEKPAETALAIQSFLRARRF